MLFNLTVLVIGITTLYAGGELFIRGSSGTAYIFRIKPLIVGLMVTAFATSSPEFFVSLLAAIRESKDLAIGNIVGSCICNIAMVLGIAALIKPIDISASILRRELPILIAVTLGFFIMCLDFKISRLDGVTLILAFILFVIYYIRNAKAEDNKDSTFLKTGKNHSKLTSFFYLIVGLLGLLCGAHLMVGSSVSLARYFGISELAIGLTAVAIGTSLPELATSVVALLHGESDISVGNVIGSNIFNILAIVGVVCIINPIKLNPSIVIISIPLLILYTLALAPILKTGFKISRTEGAFLLVSYGVYLYFTLK